MFKILPNTKLLIAFGILATTSATFSLMFAHNAQELALSMATVGPLGYSLLNLTAILSLWEWVGPQRRGLATGLVSMVRVIAVSVVLVFEMTLLNNKGVVVSKEGLFSRQIFERFKLFIWICGGT